MRSTSARNRSAQRSKRPRFVWAVDGAGFAPAAAEADAPSAVVAIELDVQASEPTAPKPLPVSLKVNSSGTTKKPSLQTPAASSGAAAPIVLITPACGGGAHTCTSKVKHTSAAS
jgi:hypothetical protein